MPAPTDEKAKLYNAEWRFTFNVREPCPVVNTKSSGPIRVRKVVMMDRDGKVLVEVFGPQVNVGGYRGVTFRSQRFNVNGYEQYPQAPDWILEAIRTAGFGRTEV